MILRPETNAVTYFAFQFPAGKEKKKIETKRMYQVSRHLPDVQENL
jgi:hypothetical protein